MNWIYSLVIVIYTGIIHLVSPFNGKARLWVRGRRGWQAKLRENISGKGRTIWIHCASLGEFEQGRPVIEKLKEKLPDHEILVTFFSPSGYEIRKSWPGADYVCYLPADTPSNARQFIDIASPSLALFVKYEFWNNYISALYRKNIPVSLISGIFRPDQHFFRWYGGFFRKLLRKYSRIFVQDNASSEILATISISEPVVTGDTRFDRVSAIASTAAPIPMIEEFRCGENILLAGSSWPQDEEIITNYINRNPGRLKWIFAPHEVDPGAIERLERMLKVKSVRFSESSGKTGEARVLIIDSIGQLSSAYRYASVAAVGGGFGKGIHNILEPACWGIPVLFGPNHHKFREAAELLSLGGAFEFGSYEEFREILDRLLSDNEFLSGSSAIAREYVESNRGASEKIVRILLEKDINRY